MKTNLYIWFASLCISIDIFWVLLNSALTYITCLSSFSYRECQKELHKSPNSMLPFSSARPLETSCLVTMSWPTLFLDVENPAQIFFNHWCFYLYVCDISIWIAVVCEGKEDFSFLAPSILFLSNPIPLFPTKFPPTSVSYSVEFAPNQDLSFCYF